MILVLTKLPGKILQHLKQPLKLCRRYYSIISKNNSDAGGIAKIEKPEALFVIDQISAAADGIMVARADLRVEIPFDEVPLFQKQIVEKWFRYR